MMDIKLDSPDFEENLEVLKFLQELTALSDKYQIYIEGCGCCGSPWISDTKNNKTYDNLHMSVRGKYEVDWI